MVAKKEELENLRIGVYRTEIPDQRVYTRILDSCRTRGIIRTTGIIAVAGICKAVGERLGSAIMQNIWKWEGCRFDREHGVCTAERVSIKTLKVVGSSAQSGSAYVAVRPVVLRELFGGLRIGHERFRLIDFGSGMGRVLLWAADYPFREIIGVEFSPALHAIAERNIFRYRSASQRCFSIHSECLSAEDYEFPEGDLALFFNNPFGPQVMEAVLERLDRALATQKREVWILYSRPTCGFLMDAAPFLEKVAESATTNYHWYSIYKSKQSY